MKIKKFTKLKNGMYNITLENFEFKIHEDLILKYNLLLTKDVTEEDIENLEKENTKYEVYEIALKELKKRLRSKKELRNILEKKQISMEYIDNCIELLTEQGYLSDDIYAQSYVHDKILLSSDGPLKIKKELLNHEISEDVIQKYLINFTKEIEEEKITKIIERHKKSNKKSKIAFQTKMKQYLANNLGFHSHVVDSLLSNLDIDDSNSYQKEYDKLYKKLSRKYEGATLEYKIKEKLYQKGFKIH